MERADTMKHLTPSPMKALTLWQPWASLVINNAKPYEFRGRSYREYVNPPRPGDRISVHAAARPTRLTEVNAILARILAGDAPDPRPKKSHVAFRRLRREPGKRPRASLRSIGGATETGSIRRSVELRKESLNRKCPSA
jgi:hypothetical protein